MEIVRMVPEHYPSLVRLWSSFPGNTMTGADSREGFDSFLERNGGHCFTLLDSHAPAGSVMAGHDGRRGYVYHLAVREDLQGKGFGRDLMERCECSLRASGIEKVHLFIYSDNPAVEFYRAIGWHLREDIEVMSKVLDGPAFTGTRVRKG